MRKFIKFFNILFFVLLIGCNNSRINSEVVKYLENEDDNLCIQEGTRFEYQNSKDIYWKCRLRLVNQRIDGEFNNYGNSLFYKREFKRIRRVIKNRLKDIEEDNLTRIYNGVEEKKHSYCLVIQDQDFIPNDYSYFQCRKELDLKDENFEDYSKLTNDLVFQSLQDKGIKNTFIENKNDINYDCIKYANNKELLEECQKSIIKITSCLKNIDVSIKKRMVDDNIFCQKQSLSKYPDSLSSFTNTTTNAFGPKIDKLELINLRKNFFDNCLKERNSRLPKYQEYLQNQCKIEILKTIEEKK